MFSSEGISKKLGEYLRVKRVDAGLSQKQVADKLKYSTPQFVSNFERGLCAPPMKALRVLVRLYNLNASEFTNFVLELQEEYLKREIQGVSRARKAK
ncbi:MAG: helix-turn-helix domain-containing protein [Bdellovibrionales bacterium]|nr:helix-turn-helix domain-containing protein [Bdellovibrionales bacterium]